MNYVYDTNIIIYHLKEIPSVEKYFSTKFIQTNNLFISVITKIELLAYPDITYDEETTINNLLKNFSIKSLTREIENLTIKMKRNNNLKIPDTIIAATSILTDSTLITRNIDDYKNIHSLKLLNPFDN